MGDPPGRKAEPEIGAKGDSSSVGAEVPTSAAATTAVGGPTESGPDVARLLEALAELEQRSEERRDRSDLVTMYSAAPSAYDEWGRARAVHRGIRGLRDAVRAALAGGGGAVSLAELALLVETYEDPPAIVQNFPCARTSLASTRRKLAAWIRAGMRESEWPRGWDV